MSVRFGVRLLNEGSRKIEYHHYGYKVAPWTHHSFLEVVQLTLVVFKFK